MKLATLKDGSRDGQLIVVSRDLSMAHVADAIAPTLQRALDDWDAAAPALRALADRLDSGAVDGTPVDPHRLGAPLPRAYEWIDGSAFLNHVILVRKARKAEPPATLETDPLIYQGGSGGYGYNFRYLAPFDYDANWAPIWQPVRIEHCRTTSRTIAMADSVGTWIDPWPSGPVTLREVPLLEPPSGEYPAVHFRHGGRTANVLFLDGHVESWSERTRNPAPGWEPASAGQKRDEQWIFDIGSDDSLWDKE